MPGNVGNAIASTVLPAVLMTAFRASSVWAVRINVYLDGTQQSHARTATPRRSWELTAHCTPAQMTALHTFVSARRFVEAFIFYDGSENGWQHDPTGALSEGKYIVRARQGWSHTMRWPRGESRLFLDQVA